MTRGTALFLTVLLMAGCAGREDAQQRKPPPAEPVESEAVAVEPPRAETPKEEAVAVEPAAAPVTPPAPETPAPGGPKVEPPAAKAPPKVPAPAVPREPAPKKERVATAPAKKPAPPPLDLDSLEKRLRETDAIGVFTKLTLKNQVDDLLDRFRAHYQGQIKTTLAELRQPYDLLIMKVLTLLQDGDPSLANAILASREAIWGILSDPKKFSSLDKQPAESK